MGGTLFHIEYFTIKIFAIDLKRMSYASITLRMSEGKDVSREKHNEYHRKYQTINREKINEKRRERYKYLKEQKVSFEEQQKEQKEHIEKLERIIMKLEDKLLTQENAIYHFKKGVSVAEKNIERVGYKIAPNEPHQPEEANSETTEPFKEDEGADFLIDEFGNVVDV
jgi:exonuclease VII small subunit